MIFEHASGYILKMCIDSIFILKGKKCGNWKYRLVLPLFYTQCKLFCFLLVNHFPDQRLISWFLFNVCSDLSEVLPHHFPWLHLLDCFLLLPDGVVGSPGIRHTQTIMHVISVLQILDSDIYVLYD